MKWTAALPIKTCLRAKCRFLRSARKWQSSVTYNVRFWAVLIHGNENRLFYLFPSYQEIVIHNKKPDDLQLIANHPVFYLRHIFPASFFHQTFVAFNVFNPPKAPSDPAIFLIVASASLASSSNLRCSASITWFRR